MQRTLVCQGGCKNPQRLPGGMLVGLGQCWIVLDGSHVGRAVPATGVWLHTGTEELRAKTRVMLMLPPHQTKRSAFRSMLNCAAPQTVNWTPSAKSPVLFSLRGREKPQ